MLIRQLYLLAPSLWRSALASPYSHPVSPGSLSTPTQLPSMMSCGHRGSTRGRKDSGAAVLSVGKLVRGQSLGLTAAELQSHSSAGRGTAGYSKLCLSKSATGQVLAEAAEARCKDRRALRPPVLNPCQDRTPRTSLLPSLHVHQVNF